MFVQMPLPTSHHAPSAQGVPFEQLGCGQDGVEPSQRYKLPAPQVTLDAAAPHTPAPPHAVVWQAPLHPDSQQTVLEPHVPLLH